MDMKAPEYIATIGDWIRGCISCHEGCCKAVSDGATFDPYLVKLPTRCIEVTATGARLRDTLGSTGCYVTVSHRWNPVTETFKTTPYNYQERISGVDLGPLSKNFDDAIAIVRRLGIQYIWIDSICIIQGSEDWDQEKWKMGQYYQHALFTISAIGRGARPMHGSSFLDPSPARAPKSLVRLPFRQEGVRKGSVYLYRRDHNAYLLFHTDVNNSDLHSRGWVFQERLLSKRIIYFTHREGFLECCSQLPQSFCNDMVKPPSLEVQERLMFGTFRSVPILPHYGLKLNFTMEHDSPLNIWYTIATSYSATTLTNKCDHLAAISGAAFEYGQAIEKQVGNREGNKKGKQVQTIPQYLSGLWLQDIHHGLMWLTEDIQGPPCVCGAPSWSWLSYQGAVNWPPRGIHAQPALKVLSAECEPAPQGVHNLPEAVIMTLQLRVKATMQPVLVVPGLQDRSRIGQLTDTLFLPQFRPNRQTATSTRTKQDSNEPYAVCHPNSPDLTGGWAMFERSPEVGQWADTPSGTVTLAVHVGSRRTGDGNALIRDFLNLGRTVYEVIFVESIGNNTFRRLGAGMIFDCNVIKGFQRDEEIEIILK
ncbi:hypothetical protein BHE90_007037 [Fusarium euwallaceae]|uniref:Heterokaryon incompatibility domain-containing protein n=1 Tax=Fusarium euwallaceae TaxID=1147111 RepID=A0A430LRS2_9HYPO|nr:hypothetical protein BHE90_007037 [Fusarium euwallaceae]